MQLGLSAATTATTGQNRNCWTNVAGCPYGSKCMAHNVMTTRLPRNIYETMSADHPYRTRHTTQGEIRYAVNFSAQSSSLTERTFKFQARKFYNQIPGEMRQMNKSRFKKEIQKWLRENVPIR